MGFLSPGVYFRYDIIEIKEQGGIIDLSAVTSDPMESSKYKRNNEILIKKIETSGPTMTTDDWQKAGIGYRDSDKTNFCCTSTAHSNGQCSYYYIGQIVNTRGNNYLSYYSSMKVNVDEGFYVIIFASCTNTDVLILDGSVTYKSNPLTPYMNSALNLGLDLGSAFNVCDLTPDINESENRVDYYDGERNNIYDDDSLNAVSLAMPTYIRQINKFFGNVSDECSDDQIEDFDTIFDEFQSCAGYDLKEFIEDFPSAIVGTLLECIITSDYSDVSDWTDLNSLSSIKISDRCLDFEFGPNSFGNLLRETWLHTDRVLPCFSMLSSKVPSCTVDYHPIPVVGSMVKSFTCIAGRMSKTIDDILKIEMKTLKLCLPDNGCEHDCVFQGSLLIPSLNLPVSDSMQRVADIVMGGYYQSTVNNYQRYLSECTEEFGGWTTHYKISQSTKMNGKKNSRTFTGYNDEKKTKKHSTVLDNVLFFFGGLLAGLIVIFLAKKYPSLKANITGRGKLEPPDTAVELSDALGESTDDKGESTDDNEESPTSKENEIV